MTVIALAALKVRIRSKERSTIGERCQVHRQTNDGAEHHARRRTQPTIRTLPQPHSCPLTTPSTSAADRKREQHRAGEVGHPPAAGSAALGQAAARQHDGRRADRHVDQEHQPPVVGGYQQPAERRTEAGGGRGDRRQQRDPVRAPRRAETRSARAPAPREPETPRRAPARPGTRSAHRPTAPPRTAARRP